MNWIQDSCVLQAADVAATYASRGYNLALGRFENLPGTNLTSYGGAIPLRRLRVVEVRAWHTGGASVSGVLFWLGVALDALHPDQMITLGNPVHSPARRGVSWVGDLPMGGGVVWRVSLGGFIAGDYVGWSVGYV